MFTSSRNTQLCPTNHWQTKANMLVILVKPIGHNTLNNMVQEMGECAKIHGNKTKYSLHTSMATCLFRAGCDEQLIMERVGNRDRQNEKHFTLLK